MFNFITGGKKEEKLPTDTQPTNTQPTNPSTTNKPTPPLNKNARSNNSYNNEIMKKANDIISDFKNNKPLNLNKNKAPVPSNLNLTQFENKSNNKNPFKRNPFKSNNIMTNDKTKPDKPNAPNNLNTSSNSEVASINIYNSTFQL